METLDTGDCTRGQEVFLTHEGVAHHLRKRGRRNVKGGLFFEIDRRYVSGWEKRLHRWFLR